MNKFRILKFLSSQLSLFRFILNINHAKLSIKNVNIPIPSSSSNKRKYKCSGILKKQNLEESILNIYICQIMQKYTVSKRERNIRTA